MSTSRKPKKKQRDQGIIQTGPPNTEGTDMSNEDPKDPTTTATPEPVQPEPKTRPPKEQHPKGGQGMTTNGDITGLAKKISQCIEMGKNGFEISDNHRVELGNAILATVFEHDLGSLETHRLFAPYYHRKYPQYKRFVDNWAELIAKTKDTKKEVASVREWKSIEQKLRLFCRSQAVGALAKAKGYHKAISPEILIELQRERHHIEVIEQCIQQVSKQDLTEVQTRNLRKQLSKSYRRGKRLEKAVVVHRRVDGLIDSLNWALDDEAISFRDLARMDSAEKDQLLTKLGRLEERLIEASTYISNVLAFVRMNGTKKGNGVSRPDMVQKSFWEQVGDEVKKNAPEDRARAERGDKPAPLPSATA